MRSRILLFILIGLVLVGIGLGAAKRASKRQQQQLSQQRLAELEERERRHALNFGELAQLTKARGKQKVTVPAVATLYPVAPNPDTLEQLLPKYTVVIGQPIQQKSYVDSNESITTWYKFRIIDTLSEAPPIQSFASRTIPTELLPIESDEFLIPRAGGTVTIDGVEITQNEEGAIAFQNTQRYLLLLSLDPATKIGEIALGGQSILPINSDGTLNPNQEEHILQRAIKAHHGGSINQLKMDFKKQKVGGGRT